MSDEFIVPVCRVHHRELHRSGNEAAWWRKLNIDPIPIALSLWAQTRTDGDQSDPKLWKNARLEEGRTDSAPASQGAAGDGASETPACLASTVGERSPPRQLDCTATGSSALRESGPDLRAFDWLED